MREAVACRPWPAETYAARHGQRLNWRPSGGKRWMQRKLRRMRPGDRKKRNADRMKRSDRKRFIELNVTSDCCLA